MANRKAKAMPQESQEVESTKSTRVSKARNSPQASAAGRRTLGSIGKGKLEDFIPFKLAVIANRVSQSIGHLFETKFNLQIPEWRILMVLYAYKSLVFNEVVERTSMDKARVSRAQRRLVDLNMIKTAVDPMDGRRLILSLTPVGAKRCAEILPAAAEREAWYLSALDDNEHKQLDIILDKLMARSQELK
jgi:DNA-binding MarR family transcriptional regulator